MLFVPGDQILSAALEADPGLYERAIHASVLLAGPTSLIGLLKTIAYGWRQEALAANAQAVCELGKQLHDRILSLVGHVDGVGRSLDKAVESYNAAVGALESRVLVSARRFQDLAVTDKVVTEPRQVDRAARTIATEPPRLDLPEAGLLRRPGPGQADELGQADEGPGRELGQAGQRAAATSGSGSDSSAA